MKKTFNAFSGVFVPTFLSVIGVILYLRLGYVVGHSGVMGAIAIILLSVSITFATGLSLSSITTNIRIGDGGAYSIISQILGLEVGGSVGIPLYLAQVFSVVLYLYGFTEAWTSIFPTHPQSIVVFSAFLALFLLTFISTKIAIRTQIMVFILVVLSLFSAVFSRHWFNNFLEPQIIWDFSKTSFWSLFALFFPAVTGLMAGVGMSGELEDPKRQIPRGVLTGLIVSSIIYIFMAMWYGYVTDSVELVLDSMVMAKYAAFSPLVVVGILAATFSSALTTFVAAPRILLAMGEHQSLPFSKFFANLKNGEPRHATLFTAILIIMTLPFSSLNTIAPILTMFFLIAYIIINLVIFLEKSLGLPSFRPTIDISRIIPLYGALSSLVVMFLINAFAGIVALVLLGGVYMYLIHKNLKPKEGDVRSGLLRSIAEWSARKIRNLPEATTHIWKPSILVPVKNTEALLSIFPFVRALAYPTGTMAVLGIADNEEEEQKELEELHEIVARFQEEGIFTASSVLLAKNHTEGIRIAVQALGTNVFHHNILLYPTNVKRMTKKTLDTYFRTAEKMQIGLVFFLANNVSIFGSEKNIHVWIPSKTLKKEMFEDKMYDLALLLAYQLYRNWKGNMTIWMAVEKGEENKARYYLKKLLYEARFAQDIKVTITTENFEGALAKAPRGDIHILPVSDADDVQRYKQQLKKESKSFLLVADSGLEDVIA